MTYFGVKDGTKAHMLYDLQHDKIRVSRDVVSIENKKWDWCNVGENKQTVIEFTTLEEEGDATDLESAPTATPTSPHMSSLVTPQGMMDSLEQESSSESIGGSTLEDGPKKIRSLAEIYADTFEEN